VEASAGHGSVPAHRGFGDGLLGPWFQRASPRDFVGAAPLNGQPIAAFILANLVAGLVAYTGIRAWAFGDREGHRPLKSLSRFFVLGALTMAVPAVCLAVSRYVFIDSAPA
jgi:putative flippase GtrA